MPRARRARRYRLAKLFAASLWLGLSIGLLGLGSRTLLAQEDAAPEDEVIHPTLSNRDRLAKEFSDPLTTLPQIFLQDAYTPENYGTDAPLNRVIARAIIPRIPKFTLLPMVQLIRPSVALVSVPTGKGKDTRTEFGDMQLFDAFVIPGINPASGLHIGIGPTLVFPTATHRLAGQGSWQAGPLFAALYKGVPWLLAGVLVQNPISFAYRETDRPASSNLLFQPVVLLALPHGFYVKSADSTWTMSWRHNTATTIPVSFGLGHVFVREGAPPLNFFVSGEWMAYRQFAPFAPHVTVRFGLTIAFPDYRPW